MFNIKLYENVIIKIDNFIDSYKSIFLDRFVDTGIFNQELIRKNYIELSKEFRNNIYSEIKIKLSDEIILGKMILENENSIFIKVGNYRILLNYIENINTKNRFVTNINFYKK